MATNYLTIAQKIAERTANVKDWRLNKKDIALRQLAREGKGVFVGTLKELREAYGVLGNEEFEENAERCIWAIFVNEHPHPYARNYHKYSISWAAIASAE